MIPINVGVIGYGNSARVFHLPYILNTPDLHLYAFHQRTPAPKAGETPPPSKPHCTLDYPQAKHYTDIAEFLADGEIELVVVLTRQDSHAEIAEQALMAGKHVVLEKPITVNSQQADRLVEVRNKVGKLLIPFQNRRYDSDFQTVQHLLGQEALGELVEFETHYDIDLPAWTSGIGQKMYQPGAGLMFGIGVHKFDQVLHLFGRPAKVTAWLQMLRPDAGPSDIEDSYTVILTYDPDGPYGRLVVTVKTNAVTRMPSPLAYLVRGRDGAFVKFGDDPQEKQIPTGMAVTDPAFGIESEAVWGNLTTRKQVYDGQTKEGDYWIGKYPSRKGDYSNYYADVARAVRGAPQVIKLETSRDGIRLCEIARESARLGRTLPFA